MSAGGPLRATSETSRDDWETPHELFDTLNAEFRFTLDGAANESNHKCARWLGPGSNLGADAFLWRQLPLRPESIWINPPYGTAENPCANPGRCAKKACARRGYHCTERRPGLDDWVRMFTRWAHLLGHTVVADLPNATDAGWYRYVDEMANEIRLLSGRVEYVGTGASGNTGGNIIAIWRPGARPAHAHMWLWANWKHAK